MADKKKSEQTVGDVINEQLEKERSALKQDVSKPQNIQYNLEDDSKNKSGINNLFGLLKRKNTNQAPLQQTQTQTMENKNTLAPLPKTNIETEKLQIDVEKLQVEISALKELVSQSSQITQRNAESIGELRSLFFQTNKEMEKKSTIVEKLDGIVKEIEPQKIMRKLDKQKLETEQMQIRTEKSERIISDLVKQIHKMQKTLEGIKNMKTLNNIVNEIDRKIIKIETARDDAERYSEKTEKTYFEIDRRLKDIALIKEKVEQYNELLKEDVRQTDEIKIKMHNFITKEKFEELKQEFEKSKSKVIYTTPQPPEPTKQKRANKEKNIVQTSNSESKTQEIKNIMRMVQSKNNKNEKENKDEQPNQENNSQLQKQDILASLGLLEEEFKNGTISKEIFDEAKKAGELYQKQIDKEPKQEANKADEMKKKAFIEKMKKWEALGYDVSSLKKLISGNDGIK